MSKETKYAGVAISYIRFSDKRQATGGSYERQYSASTEYCEEHNLRLLDTYEDLGISAHAGKQKEGDLGRLLHHVKIGDIKPNTFLILENFDRLSREGLMSQLILYLSLLQSGVNLVILSDLDHNLQPVIHWHSGSSNAPNEREQTAQIQFALGTMARAHNESLMKSMRTRANWKTKKKMAEVSKVPLSTVCPQWLEVVDGAYKFKGGAKETVELIVEHHKAGKGYQAISTILRDLNIPVLVSSNHTTRDVKWSSNKIKKIFNSPAIYGDFQGVNGDVIERLYPHVISKDEYFAIKADEATTAMKGENTQHNNALRGLLKCECGSGLHLHQTYNKVLDRDYKVLRCAKCRTTKGNYDQMVTSLVTSINHNIGGWLHQQDETTAATRDANKIVYAEIEQLQTSLNVLMERVLNGATLSDTMQGLMTNLETKIEGLKKTLVKVTQSTDILKTFGDEILDNGYLDIKQNRVDLNKFLLQVIPDGVQVYKHTSNCSTMTFDIAGDKVCASYYRLHFKRPWHYGRIITDDKRTYGRPWCDDPVKNTKWILECARVEDDLSEVSLWVNH